MNSVFTTIVGGTALLLVSATAGTAADMQIPMKATPFVQPVGPSPILYVNNQISLDAIDQHLNYVGKGTDIPTVPYGTMTTDKGWQPGLQLTGSAMFDLGAVTNVYLMGQFTWSKGNTDYMGSYIPTAAAVAAGPVPGYGSLVRRHSSEFMDFDFRIGKGFEVGRDWMFTPFVGIGTHTWNRDLDTPLYRYQHTYAGGGLMIQWAPTQQWVLTGSGFVGAIIDPTMSTPNDPAFTPSTLDLGSSKLMWKAGLSSDYALTQQWHLNAGIDYTGFDYGATTETMVKAGLQPMHGRDSRSDIWTVKAGFGYSFYRPTSRF